MADPPRWEERPGIQAQQVEGDEAADVPQGAVPVARRRRPQRHEIPAHAILFYPARQPRPPRPEPITHEAVYDMTQQRFDQLEDRMNVNQQWTMQSHHRQDDMLRYMMRDMSLDIPRAFAGLLPPPVYGGEQQVPYVYGQYLGYDQWGAIGGYGNQYGWRQPEEPGEKHMEEAGEDDE